MSWAGTLEVLTPNIALTEVAAEFSVTGADSGETLILVAGDRQYSEIADAGGNATFSDVVFSQRGNFEVSVRDSTGATSHGTVRVIPGWVTITPPLVAIVIALTLRNVIPALLIGIWFGAAALRSFTPAGIFNGLLDSFQVFVTQALANQDHAAIVLFSVNFIAYDELSRQGHFKAGMTHSGMFDSQYDRLHQVIHIR